MLHAYEHNTLNDAAGDAEVGAPTMSGRMHFLCCNIHSSTAVWGGTAALADVGSSSCKLHGWPRLSLTRFCECNCCTCFASC